MLGIARLDAKIAELYLPFARGHLLGDKPKKWLFHRLFPAPGPHTSWPGRADLGRRTHIRCHGSASLVRPSWQHGGADRDPGAIEHSDRAALNGSDLLRDDVPGIGAKAPRLLQDMNASQLDQTRWPRYAGGTELWALATSTDHRD
jgi:hypothetical protein